MGCQAAISRQVLRKVRNVLPLAASQIGSVHPPGTSVQRPFRSATPQAAVSRRPRCATLNRAGEADGGAGAGRADPPPTGQTTSDGHYVTSTSALTSSLEPSLPLMPMVTLNFPLAAY